MTEKTTLAQDIFGRILEKLKTSLAKMSSIQEFLSNLVILSEYSITGDYVEVIAHMIDYDEESQSLVFRKKKIVYDIKKDEVVSIRNID